MKLSWMDFGIILVMMLGVALAFHFFQKLTIDVALGSDGKAVDVVKKSLFSHKI